MDMNDTISNNINKLMQNNPSSNADLQEQALIDKALIKAGLPQNKLNEMLELMRDKITCNPACQKQRQVEAYKKTWELAKKKYKAAPEEIKQAEKNYYVYDRGYAAYKHMLYDRYAKTAAEFKTSSNIKHAAVDEELQEMTNSYDEGTIYLKRMNELLQIKLTEKEQLQRDIDNYIGLNETSGRKVVYEDRARDWLTTYRTVMIYFFLIMLVFYIVFGDFIPTSAYKEWKVWLLMVLIVIIPYFLVDRLVKLIFAGYNYITGWGLRKNVYVIPNK